MNLPQTSSQRFSEVLMGHQRIGVLPKTRTWRDVVDIIAGGADVATVAYRTAKAAERALGDRSNDPAVRSAFLLLARIPLAARSSDFGTELRKLGLNLGEAPTLTEITIALLERVDLKARGRRTDFGEMVALCAVESLQATAGRSLDDLFGWQGSSPGRTKEVLAGLATVKQFGLLAKDFFGRLLDRLLKYYLDRELPNHVGLNRRFASLRELDKFEKAIGIHARETAEITRQFAGEWHSKHAFEDRLGEKDAGVFVSVALKKLLAELRLRDPTHA